MDLVKKQSGWPDNFNFDTDKTCQEIFRPFIEKQIELLKAYDQKRPPDTLYVFHEHAMRVAEDTKNTCLYLGLDQHIANNMYWAALPHDIGKSRLPLDIWDLEDKPDEETKKLRRTHTLLGVQIVNEFFPDINHPFKDLMIDIMAWHHEHLDGSGSHGKTKDQLSKAVRLLSIIEAYDGYRIWRPHFGERDISTEGVLKKMHEEKGAAIYDMDLLEAFAAMKQKEAST